MSSPNSVIFDRIRIVVIRPALKKDLVECEKLGDIPEFESPGGDHIDKKFMENYLDKNFFLVVQENSKIIGYIIGEVLRGKGVIIWYFTIKKEGQRKGFGKKLLIEFEKRCKRNGIDWVVLYGPAFNINTLEFYKKMRYVRGNNFYEFVKEFDNEK